MTYDGTFRTLPQGLFRIRTLCDDVMCLQVLITINDLIVDVFLYIFFNFYNIRFKGESLGKQSVFQTTDYVYLRMQIAYIYD